MGIEQEKIESCKVLKNNKLSENNTTKISLTEDKLVNLVSSVVIQIIIKKQQDGCNRIRKDK